MNQIRKIVASVIEVLLGRIDRAELVSYFSADVVRNLRMAPGEGLLLDRLYFESYDKFKCNYKDMLPIGWSLVENQGIVEDFKEDVIYPKVMEFLPEIFEKWAVDCFIENYSKNYKETESVDKEY